MSQHTFLCLLLAVIHLLAAAVLPVTTHDMTGTLNILETDSAIIIEYYGNPEDAKAARLIQEREQKQAEVDAERRNSKIEQSKAISKIKQAAREAKAAQNPDEASREEDD